MDYRPTDSLSDPSVKHTTYTLGLQSRNSESNTSPASRVLVQSHTDYDRQAAREQGPGRGGRGRGDAGDQTHAGSQVGTPNNDGDDGDDDDDNKDDEHSGDAVGFAGLVWGRVRWRMPWMRGRWRKHTAQHAFVHSTGKEAARKTAGTQHTYAGGRRRGVMNNQPIPPPS